MMNEEWQRCPSCDGRGDVVVSNTGTSEPCRTCGGHGIVHRVTGLPPHHAHGRPDERQAVVERERDSAGPA